MHSLIKTMEGELDSGLKGALTHGFDVVFRTSRWEGTLPHSADEAIVCDVKRMGTMRRFVDDALESWRRKSCSSDGNKLSVDQLHRAMLQVGRIRLVIAGDHMHNSVQRMIGYLNTESVRGGMPCAANAGRAGNKPGR